MNARTGILFSGQLLILFLLSLCVHAQVRQPFINPAPPVPGILCGADGRLREARHNAAFLAREAQMNAEVLSALRRLDDEVITLPVVFHIIHQDPTGVPDQRILDALKELNDAFANAGSFATAKGVDTRIRFCLAQKDSDGGVTTGINRVKSFFSTSLSPLIEDRRLKNLVQWDPSRYINIWYVQSMEEEQTAIYNCDTWFRARYGGYATMPPGGGPQDGIVVSGFGNLLTHEMGHYLGLYHTFEGLSCANSNCETEGDRVCDTPPDRSMNFSPCSNPENSCSSDTLSGFTSDMPDPIDNYMDYGNGGCALRFTQGQADRMKAVVSTQRPGLKQHACERPCTDAVTAFIQRDNPYPLPGDVLHFSAVSSGGTRYEWLVNGVVESTDPSFTRSFGASGKYKVTLKVYSSASCYATYSDNLMVTCGVTARFYTNQRTIASKDGITLDSVKFTNTSEKATTFKWLMSSDRGMAEQVISTTKDLTYVFRIPANYTVRLIASNGSCSDTTEPYPVTVFDPTPDGQLNIWDVSCYQQTKLQVTFWVCNWGYKALPAGVPISFYDADPRNAGAHKLGAPFFLPSSIPGHCCGYLMTHIVDVGRAGLNQLYAVYNDSGTTVPLRLPNTPVPDLNVTNNFAFRNNFSFQVSALPVQLTAEPGDTLNVGAMAGPGAVSGYRWWPAYNLSCASCPTTHLIADTTSTKYVVATSRYGCFDTATLLINVPPANDYTVTIDKAACAANQQLHIDFTLRNTFKRGVIPKGLTVSFYRGDPAGGGAVWLPPVYEVADSVLQKSASFSALVQGMDAGPVYAVVNDKGGSPPIVLPNTKLQEKAYSNNTVHFDYTPETVQLQPSDTTVLRNTSLQLTIASPLSNPATVAWQNGYGYTLSCSNCPTPAVTVRDSARVFVQTQNSYGCTIKGTASIKILPPDMKVSILQSECFTNNSVQVRFEVCMNNNYDSVWAGIPVAFYDGDPANGKLLQPVFYTPAPLPGGCYTFTHMVATPSGRNLYAVVNDKGRAGGRVFAETDYANNWGQTLYEPFAVHLFPADTSIPRLQSVELQSGASGGTMTAYNWSPVRYVSCAGCPATTVQPPYTMTYQLVATNEHACTDTAYALIKTYSGGIINMPNAFTPNADGNNDVFYVLAGAEASRVKDFSIFNRWGEQVFRVSNVPPNDPTYGWKGVYKGGEAMGGVYVYYVSLEETNGRTEVYRGTVVLVR